MKIDKKILVILFSLFTNTSGFSTHIKGGEITVRQLSKFDFHIIVTGYKDKAGVEWGTGTLNLGDGSIIDTKVQDWSKEHYDDATEIHSFSIIHTYNAPGKYFVGYTESNRNDAIINIDNGQPTSADFYIETEIIVSEVGSSLYTSILFLSPPVFKASVREEFTYNVTAYDPEGNSILQFLLIPCLQGRGITVPNYEFPDAVYINSTTGLITWTPTKAGAYNFAVRVNKLVEGKSTGYVIRDFNVIVEGEEVEQQIAIKNKDEIDFLKENSILVEPEDSLELEISFFSNDSDLKSLVAISEVSNGNYPFASFSTKDSGDYLVGKFTFKSNQQLVRKTPYIVTFRGGGGEFYKDLTLLIHTTEPEEDIINHLGNEETIEVQYDAFPNPASTYFKIRNFKEDELVQLFSSSGNLVRTYYLNEEPLLPVSNLGNGMYFYKVWRKENLLKSGKLIVDK